jgi:acetylornithine/succinyldiaminopimelate/putrescine aminotransferase
MPTETSPLATALERVGDRWTLLVVEALLEGPRRFGDLREEVTGIAPNILSARLRKLESQGVVGVRVRGLWAGVDVDPGLGSGRDVCVALAERGVLAKDTHGSTIRLAPPLVIERADLEWGLEQLSDALSSLAGLDQVSN